MNEKYVVTSWYCIMNRTKLRHLFPASISVKPKVADVGAAMCSRSFALYLLSIMSALYSISLPDLNIVLTCA